MKTLVFFAGFLFCASAFSIEIPRAIALGSSDFTSKTLGSACYGMDVLAGSLPCNPAFVAKERRSIFQTQFFFGNNISYLSDIARLVDGDADAAMAERLFNQRSSSEMEASIQASFLSENWGLSFVPYRLFYYALIRNSALPTITLFAGQERSATGQIASYAEGNFYWGLQLRGVERKFVLSEFTLTDALAEGGTRHFDSKTQRAIYLEPGLLYSFEDFDWRPQTGLTIKNAGAVDRKYDGLPNSPEWHWASSIRPPLGYGELEFGVDFLFSSNAPELKDIAKFGASYRIGAVQTLASIGDSEYSLGFILQYYRWNGGLSYWRQKFKNLLGESDQMQTVYMEIGYSI
ncbi:MAG: hypothetical protein IPM97_02800 [Bdellovibrionaceae bacterium]|nr:hypothetical protein [Pseudobdellovibrionaceae bacterium]